MKKKRQQQQQKTSFKWGFQALWIEIHSSQKSNIICGIVCREHNSPKRFQEYFDETLKNLIASNKTVLVHGPESETLPPPRGFLQTCIISKLHPRVFEKCMFALDWLVGVAVQQHSFPQQSHRLPTPRGELTSSETPLPTKITLKVI